MNENECTGPSFALRRAATKNGVDGARNRAHGSSEGKEHHG